MVNGLYNNLPFGFGYTADGKPGYIVSEGGADAVIPFKSWTSIPARIVGYLSNSTYAVYPTFGRNIRIKNTGYVPTISTFDSFDETGATDVSIDKDGLIQCAEHNYIKVFIRTGSSNYRVDAILEWVDV